MKLELMRDAAKSMPIPEDPAEVSSLCVWHCKYKTLEPITAFENLRTLKIATFPDESFELLSSLGHLERLSVLHLPKVADLEALRRIKTLRFLALQTLPSWDSSRKRTVIQSLEPLSELPKLQHVSLFGVVPKDMSLRPLERCKRLETAKFQGYPAAEVERFFQASKVVAAPMPEES